MASIGNKIKEAAMKAAKDKMPGDKEGKKRTGGSESGAGKAKRAILDRLK